jgi:hypothetical protein
MGTVLYALVVVAVLAASGALLTHLFVTEGGARRAPRRRLGEALPAAVLPAPPSVVLPARPPVAVAPPPPQLSADGAWWWTGADWVPASSRG